MAWEWLEKYLRGKAPDYATMVQPGTGGIMESGVQQSGTQGLFGTGGEYGQGGLFTTFNQPDLTQLGETFSNPLILGSLRAIQAGAKGQNIMQAAPEAIIGGVKDAYTIGKFKKFQKEKKAMEKLLASDEISDINKLLISVGKNPLPEKRGSFEKKVDYIMSNNPRFTRNELIDILIKQTPKWNKERFQAEAYQRTLTFTGSTSSAEKALEAAGESWNKFLISAGKDSGTDLSGFSLTELGSKEYGSVKNIVDKMKIKHPNATIEEIIKSLKEQKIIQ